MQMQDFRSKTRDDAAQPNRKRRTDRRVQKLSETRHARYVGIVDLLSRRMPYPGFRMREHRDVDAYGREADTEIRACALDAAGVR